MRPFWLRPTWVLGHVLALALVVAFVNFGFWQLRRLDERQERNATIESRSGMPVLPIGELVSADDPLSVGEALAFRQASAEGEFDVDGEVLVRNRSQSGRAGVHVLTPLVLDGGDAVLVNRGFVATGGQLEGVRAQATPPPGRVELVGLVTATQERGSIGPRDPDEGVLGEVSRADVGRVRQQYDRPLAPVVLQLEAYVPAQPEPLPVPVPTPMLSEGSHLSYAFQWFAFALIGALGWPLLLKRTAKDARRAERPPTSVPPAPQLQEVRA